MLVEKAITIYDLNLTKLESLIHNFRTFNASQCLGKTYYLFYAQDVINKDFRERIEQLEADVKEIFSILTGLSNSINALSNSTSPDTSSTRNLNSQFNT